MTTRLFHISDIHFGIEDRSALEAVSRAVRDEQPDALICTGDLTQRAKHREYAAAARWFRSLGLPVMIEPGNHDMPYYNPVERFTDPYRRYRRLMDEIHTPFASADVVFVSLKSTVRAQRRFPWSDGVVTREALAGTLERLENLQAEERHVLVTAHHPLLGPKGARKNPTIGGDRAFAAIAQSRADAILTGHVHRPFDEVREAGQHSLRMIGAGTLSHRLRHGAPPSYWVIECTKGNPIRTQLRELAPAPR